MTRPLSPTQLRVLALIRDLTDENELGVGSALIRRPTIRSLLARGLIAGQSTKRIGGVFTGYWKVTEAGHQVLSSTRQDRPA